MGLEIVYEDGQTPLDEDEKDGLQFPNITTRGELDELEQRNIEIAVKWLFGRPRRFSPDKILTEEFICDLHKRMLSGVWQWAGSFRNSNKNLGVDKYQVAVKLRELIDDCKYWIEHEVFSPDEIAVRFKHRIVSIHCFANGNGRHSRLIADIIIEKIFDGEVFTWGGNNSLSAGEFRAKYLSALRAADQDDYQALIQFARS